VRRVNAEQPATTVAPAGGGQAGVINSEPERPGGSVSEYIDEQVSVEGEAVVARLVSEPGFLDTFRADPRKALTDFGLSEDSVSALEELMAAAEVEGFTFDPAGFAQAGNLGATFNQFVGRPVDLIKPVTKTLKNGASVTISG